MIETKNLVLVPCEAKHIDAFIECKHLCEQLLGAYIPDNWPIVLELLPFWQQELHRDASLAGWLNWLYIEKENRTVIGDGGFKGKPDANGTVEIGYAILPEYRGRGFASEAADALVDWAFCQHGVVKIIAHTYPDGLASQHILRKTGFKQGDKCFDLEDGDVIWWALTRKRYLKLHYRRK